MTSLISSAQTAEPSSPCAADVTQAIRRSSLIVIECAGPPNQLVVSAWNDQATHLFGHAKAEAIGQPLASLIPSPKDGQAWQRVLEAEHGAFVCNHVRKDGKTVTCEWFPAPVLDESGNRIGIVCVGRDITEQTRALQEAAQEKRLLRAVLDELPIVICQYDRGGTVLFQDGKGLIAVGMKPGQLVGVNLYEVHKDNPTVVRAFAGERLYSIDESYNHAWETWYAPVLDDQNQLNGTISMTLDGTEAKRREDELRSKLELIDKQQQVIRALSTPIIEIWDRVLTVPMVGVVDSKRTMEVMENLLSAVVSKGALFAILDLTGVEVIDTGTASHLINLIRAIRLLGAEGIITGILPSVAQTLISLGIDLTGIVTQGNLRAGLKVCLDRMAQTEKTHTQLPNKARPSSR